MDSLLDEPAAILVALSVAAALFVIEVALPTAGLAGTLALVLGTAGVVGLARQGVDWWPLLLPKAAVVIWIVMIARRVRTPAAEVVAVGLFAGGSVIFGLLADSWITAAVGVVIAAGLGLGFPRLHRAAVGLLDQPPQSGMASLVGEPGTVVDWSGVVGTVRVEGSLWGAMAALELAPGDLIEVVGHERMTVVVGPRAHHQAQGA